MLPVPYGVKVRSTALPKVVINSTDDYKAKVKELEDMIRENVVNE